MAKEKSIPVTPINGKLLISPEQKEKVTATGLYLAESSSSSEKPQIGIVIKLGKEKLDEKGNKIEFNVKEGMKVMFRRYSGDEIEFDGKKYIIMDEESIMAIIEE